MYIYFLREREGESRKGSRPRTSGFFAKKGTGRDGFKGEGKREIDEPSGMEIR